MKRKQHNAYNPRSEKFQSRPQLKELTTKTKNEYEPFALFELEFSRLMRYPNFQTLLQELSSFNEQLKKWQKEKIDLKNIIVTYSLYRNLFSRLRYVTYFARTSGEASQAVNDLLIWFFTEKPKIRGLVPEVQPILKPQSLNQRQINSVNRFVEKGIQKREAETYELTSRTIHNEFLPPKQQLKEYRRKQFLPIERQGSVSSFSKTSTSMFSKMKHMELRSTMSTLMQSKSSFSKTSKSMKNVFTNIIKKNYENQEQQLQDNMELANQMEELREKQLKLKELTQKNKPIIQYQLDVIQRQKDVHQNTLIQDKIIVQLNEEDKPDSVSVSDFQQKQQPKCQNNKKKKPYMEERKRNDEIQVILEQKKENQQSSLKKFVNENQSQIRNKIESQNMKKSLMLWAKVKGKVYSEQKRKGETCHNLKDEVKKYEIKSKFSTTSTKSIKLNSTEGLNQKKKPEQVQLHFRSRSLHSLEADKNKIKVRNNIANYKNLINHCNIEPEFQSEKEGKQIESFRSTSLTSFIQPPKRRSFSNFLATHKPSSYNVEVSSEIDTIKEKFASKSVMVNKKKLFKAMSVERGIDVNEKMQMPQTGKDLLSNPFFPKQYLPKKKVPSKKKKK